DARRGARPVIEPRRDQSRRAAARAFALSGDKAPVERGEVLGDVLDHVGSLLDQFVLFAMSSSTGFHLRCSACTKVMASAGDIARVQLPRVAIFFLKSGSVTTLRRSS